ncbi:MAG: putative GTPase ArgK [Syntrophorhabdus sp. PtaU1.Bin050]|nr:MAG: putative GTPase ArgK [Syntrophorhabdus sp. PtaU1.Bin050]
MSLADKILKGDEGSAARLISLIEARDRKGYAELTQLLPHIGRAHVLGITGPAGAGKSTFISRVASRLHRQGNKVGIIAVDPTSMHSQGAILGDRFRMKEAEDTGEIFIRSMADRDQPGGVCHGALGAVYVMEGLGKEFIIIESVGAGQSDKALFYICDTVVTVFTPEFGDELQLLKAGLLEIGDIVVLNKCDKPGSEGAANALSTYIPLKTKEEWSAPILMVKAHVGEGIDDFIGTIRLRWNFLQEKQRRLEMRRKKTTMFLMTLLKEELWKRFADICSKDKEYGQILKEVECNTIDLYSAMECIADSAEVRLLSRP